MVNNLMDLVMTIVLCASFAGALWIGWKIGDVIRMAWGDDNEVG